MANKTVFEAVLQRRMSEEAEKLTPGKAVYACRFSEMARLGLLLSLSYLFMRLRPMCSLISSRTKSNVDDAFTDEAGSLREDGQANLRKRTEISWW
jgi:hypothetical protein